MPSHYDRHQESQRRLLTWIGGSLLALGCGLDPANDIELRELASEGTEASTSEPSTTVEESATSAADSTGAPSVCGDENVDPGEDCDDGGESDECDDDCTAAVCGDGVLNLLAGEVCDDGNLLGGDACTPTCLPNPKIVQMVMDGFHTCVVLDDGAMRCWGRGLLGALGYENMNNLGDQPGELPTPDVNVGGHVVRATAGSHRTCAVLDTGAVRCWGAASFGALGNGMASGFFGNDPGEMPPPNVAVGVPVKDIKSSGLFSCVITQDDNVRCWGTGTSGRLGYGNTNTLGDQPGELPVPDLELGGPVAQLSVSDSHACALLQDGTLRCWGSNYYGQLGYGDTNHRGDAPGEMPPPPVDAGGPVARVTASTDFTCAVLTNGEVRCWGRNSDSQLGYSPSDTAVGDAPGEMPPPALALADDATHVSLGAGHGCVRLQTGALQCWGSNSFGAVGVPNAYVVPAPTTINVGGLVAQVASSNSHNCAVLADDTLRCWGGAVFGRLGLGHEEIIGDDETPASAGPVPY
ncbi:RCC1 domain-containing protein [Nannocystis pusilla]|uniref:RCC1 domain-containing protein n=1 Tax=Nannocystis pusilla TaxID=889268 RepID=UPI003DA327C1